MAGKFLRGAFVQFKDTFLLPVPNVIIFQFNPEQIVHSWTPAQSAAQTEDDNPLAVKGAPGETFQFMLQMDAADMIADGSPVAKGIATVSGVYTRIAALERGTKTGGVSHVELVTPMALISQVFFRSLHVCNTAHACMPAPFFPSPNGNFPLAHPV